MNSKPEVASSWIPKHVDTSKGLVSDGIRLLQKPPKQEGKKQTDDGEKSADVLSAKIPPNAADPRTADSLIASQMAKLSVDDREKVYMDVHGISDYKVVETPELIEQSLHDLQREIELLPNKAAYSMAEEQDFGYTHNPDFRLPFLRCEKFDCSKAALRIIRHFQMKLDLFCESKLAMDITQDDLDQEDMDTLYSFSGRFLNAFDRGGRIINLFMNVPKMYRTEAALRKGFYNATVACRDEEVQRRGVVCIAFNSGSRTGSSSDAPNLGWKLPKLNEGFPIRISAIHLCYKDEIWTDHHAVIKTSVHNSVKVRTRVHHGSVLECLEQLRGHGIDPSCIPLNEKGEATDKSEHRSRLEALRKYERLKCPLRNAIGVPFREDVLLGRGIPFQRHPGNHKLRRMVMDRYKEYDKARKGTKRDIAQEIVDIIKQSGGLFLKKDDNKWVPIDDAAALVKVSAHFRSLRWMGGSYWQEPLPINQ